MEQKTLKSFGKLMSKNSISEEGVFPPLKSTRDKDAGLKVFRIFLWPTGGEISSPGNSAFIQFIILKSNVFSTQ